MAHIEGVLVSTGPELTEEDRHRAALAVVSICGEHQRMEDAAEILAMLGLTE